MTDFLEDAAADDLAQLTAWADAVDCSLERTSERSDDGTLYWRVVSPIGPRLYGHLRAARWAI